MENNNAKLRAISVMKIDGKALNKILGSETEQVYFRFEEMGLTLGYLFMYFIKLREEKMIISVDMVKNLVKVNIDF